MILILWALVGWLAFNALFAVTCWIVGRLDRKEQVARGFDRFADSVLGPPGTPSRTSSDECERRYYAQPTVAGMRIAQPRARRGGGLG